MSHTTTIKGLAVRVPESIENAVAMLIEQGKNIELLTDTVPRMYYRDQEAAIGKCDYVIKVKSGRYDVGLKWRGEERGFELIYDAYGGDIARELGITDRTGVEPDDMQQTAIAEFVRSYNVDLIKTEAIEQGYTEFDYSYADDGTIQLVASMPEEEFSYA